MDIQRRRDIPGDLGIVGVGAIAEAIITGLCEGEHTPTSIHLSPRSAERATRLAARYPSVHVVDSNQTVVERADVVLLSLRPQDAPAAVSDLAFRVQQTVISVTAGVPIDALRPLVAPAEVLVRAIPLPAVARRAGLTAIHPRHELARAIFDPLGGVIAVDDERALDALSASTATIAAHLAYLDTISRWLADRGIPQADATRYVAAVFGSLSGTLRDTHPTVFRTLADEYATAGGINEQFLTAPAARAPSTSSTAHSTTWPIDSKASEPAGLPLSMHPDGAMSPGARRPHSAFASSLIGRRSGSCGW
jgi:pyrroline-5-carboxylate reductase